MKAGELIKEINEHIKALAQNVDDARASEEVQAFVQFMARFHKYSWRNCMLIFLYRPDATMVAGYRKWNEFGRYVMKGEHGIPILAPCFPRKSDTDDDNPNPVFYKPVYVFDVSQTDGEPLPEEPDWVARGVGDEEIEAALFDLAASWDIEVEIGDTGTARGESRGGMIRLSEELDGYGRMKTLTHELAHELLHKGTANMTIPRQVREVQAEATAAVVLMHFGFDVPSAHNYLALWEADAKAVNAQMNAVQKAAQQIIEGLEEILLPEGETGLPL